MVLREYTIISPTTRKHVHEYLWLSYKYNCHYAITFTQKPSKFVSTNSIQLGANLPQNKKD